MPLDMTRSQRKRAAIVKAAIAEFRAGGFRDTSMDRIAERAEVSKRTVYNHFASKDELFEAITLEMMARVEAASRLEYDPERSLEDQLREIAQHEETLFASKDFMGVARVLMAEAFRSPDSVQKIFAKIKEGEGGLTSWVRAAHDDGRLRVDDPGFAAQQFTALLKGAMFWPQALGLAKALPKKQRQAVVESTLRMFLDHYEV
jgi:TetR/AcrR family transcriptional regulator of autoinduction and epiphytic fitness